jgi:uncharacterized membrane protein YgcG
VREKVRKCFSIGQGVDLMIAKNLRKTLTLILCFVFVHYSPQTLGGYQSTATSPSDDSGAPTETTPQDAAQLQSLVAPIALYPDALVAQILSASTFPDQVAIADYWLEENKSLAGSALMQAVDKQSWDPSVKALTQFPSVLDNMAKNLSWTSSLGDAFHNQQADVMTAVQTLRAQAKAKGNLKTTSQITVVQQSPQVIEIQPTNPQVVYVPVYNPAVVYGYPYVVPAYVAPPSTADVVAAGLIGFGAGIAVGAMMAGGCCGWGYSAWGCGWHGTAVVYHGGAYYGNTAWHGGYYNSGYHGSYGYNNHYNNSNYHSNNYNNYSHNGNNYSHSGNTYNYNNVNVNKQNAQNFNSDRSSGSNSWGQHSGGGSSNAFSGMSGHSGGFGDSGGGGWSSRAESSRGWGSMGSSGFGGGRFGGGGGGGGGRSFGGGGFRR